MTLLNAAFREAKFSNEIFTQSRWQSHWLWFWLSCQNLPTFHFHLTAEGVYLCCSVCCMHCAHVLFETISNSTLLVALIYEFFLILIAVFMIHYSCICYTCLLLHLGLVLHIILYIDYAYCSQLFESYFLFITFFRQFFLSFDFTVFYCQWWRINLLG